MIPLLDAFFTWAQTAERKLSARSELAQALRYIIKRRTALTRFATDARLEADNNIAENAIRWTRNSMRDKLPSCELLCSDNQIIQ